MVVVSSSSVFNEILKTSKVHATPFGTAATRNCRSAGGVGPDGDTKLVMATAELLKLSTIELSVKIRKMSDEEPFSRALARGAVCRMVAFPINA